jgi:O-antigen/teichoic acid export membrane protein
MLLLRVDTFILEHIRGIAEVGTYSIATGLAEMVLLIPSALGTVLFARLPAATRAEREAVTPVMVRRTLLVSGVLCAILAVASSNILAVVAGPRFVSAGPAMRLLLPGVLAMSMNYVLYNFFASTERIATAVGCFLLGVVMNVLLNLYLVPRYGQNGAAIASSVSYISTTALLLHHAARSLGQRLSLFLVPSYADILASRDAILEVSRARLRSYS